MKNIKYYTFKHKQAIKKRRREIIMDILSGIFFIFLMALVLLAWAIYADYLNNL